MVSIINNNLTLFLEQSDGLLCEFLFIQSSFLDNLNITNTVLMFINYIAVISFFSMCVVKKDFITMSIFIEVTTLSIFLYYVVGSLIFGLCVGQIYSLFVLTLMVIEAAVGLSIIVKFFKNKGSIYIDTATDVF